MRSKHECSILYVVVFINDWAIIHIICDYVRAIYKEEVDRLLRVANTIFFDSSDLSLNNGDVRKQTTSSLSSPPPPSSSLPSSYDSNIDSTTSRTYNYSTLENIFLIPVSDLMKAAHHYCDLLHHLQRSSPPMSNLHSSADNIEGSSYYQLKGQSLRYVILQLIISKVDGIRQVLSNIDHETTSILLQLQQTSQITSTPLSPSAEVLTLQSDLTILSMRKSALISVMLELLKKAAEAGIDLRCRL